MKKLTLLALLALTFTAYSAHATVPGETVIDDGTVMYTVQPVRVGIGRARDGVRARDRELVPSPKG